MTSAPLKVFVTAPAPSPAPAPAPTGLQGVQMEAPAAVPAPAPASGDCAVHPGVQCDGCGMLPLRGPRFKSTKLHDFDLCQRCFQRSPDRSFVVRRAPCTPWSDVNADGAGAAPSGSGGCGRRGRCGGKRLHARHVNDVTVFDGTQMAPSTAFTKIWTVRNDGDESWPEDACLSFVSGDQMSGSLHVPLATGAVPPGAEVQASVDLVAPQQKGRYIGYWRLSSGGQRFGQRMWVQVIVAEGGAAEAVAAAEAEEKEEKEQEKKQLDMWREQLSKMSVPQLKMLMKVSGLEVDCLEKSELVDKLLQVCPVNGPCMVPPAQLMAAMEGAMGPQAWQRLQKANEQLVPVMQQVGQAVMESLCGAMQQQDQQQPPEAEAEVAAAKAEAEAEAAAAKAEAEAEAAAAKAKAEAAAAKAKAEAEAAAAKAEAKAKAEAEA